MTAHDHPRITLTPPRRGGRAALRRWASLGLLAAGVATPVHPRSPAWADEPLPAARPAMVVAVPDGPGPWAGFDRELFTAVAQEAGYAVSFATAAPTAALADLDAGRIDVAAGPFPAGEAAAGGRRRALPPVLTDGDALLKRRGDGSLLAPADATGKRLALIGPPAAAARLQAEAVALRARGAERPGGFAFDPERDLGAGKVAALIGPLSDVAAAALRRPEGFEVVGPAFGPAARLAPSARGDRPEVAAKLGAAIERMRVDGRLADLQRRWFGLVCDPPEPPHPSPNSTSKP